MGRQYSFKTTRRTTYLDDVLSNIEPQDRSEILRQAVTLGLIQMGLLSKVETNFLAKYSTPVSEPKVERKVDIRPTEVEQKVDTSNTFVPQTFDKGVTDDLQEPEFIEVKEEISTDDLENALDSIKF